MTEYYYRYFKDQQMGDDAYPFNEGTISGDGPLPTHPDYERYTKYVGGYYGNGEYEIALDELDSSVHTQVYPILVVGGEDEGGTAGGRPRSLFRSTASTLDDRLVSLFGGTITSPEAVFLTLPRGRYEHRAVDDRVLGDKTIDFVHGNEGYDPLHSKGSNSSHSEGLLSPHRKGDTDLDDVDELDDGGDEGNVDDDIDSPDMTLEPCTQCPVSDSGPYIEDEQDYTLDEDRTNVLDLFG